MRTGAQIHKLSLPIEGNLRIFRKFLDQLYFICLSFSLHKPDGFFSGKGKPFQLRTLFDDLLHFLFDFVQILSGKRSRVKIVIISGVDGRSDGKFSIRKQIFYRFRQHVGTGMADNPEPGLIPCGQYIQHTVSVDNRPQIHHLTVQFSRARRTCQPFADIACDVDHGSAFCVLLHRTVF